MNLQTANLAWRGEKSLRNHFPQHTFNHHILQILIHTHPYTSYYGSSMLVEKSAHCWAMHREHIMMDGLACIPIIVYYNPLLQIFTAQLDSPFCRWENQISFFSNQTEFSSQSKRQAAVYYLSLVITSLCSFKRGKSIAF